jgi:hypothetical protein
MCPLSTQIVVIFHILQFFSLSQSILAMVAFRHFIYHNKKLRVPPTVYVFCMYVTTNGDYSPVQCVYCAVRFKALYTTKVNLAFKWAISQQHIGKEMCRAVCTNVNTYIVL